MGESKFEHRHLGCCEGHAKFPKGHETAFHVFESQTGPASGLFRRTHEIQMTASQEPPIVGGQYRQSPIGDVSLATRKTPPSAPNVAVLTAGRDRPYALGLASALVSQGLNFDFIGSDGVDSPDLRANPQVNFCNLRDQQSNAGILQKVVRILVYYCRLINYALTSRAPVFHILWNNKFEIFDRTLLMLFYQLLGKKVVFTVHNVNIRARDGGDSWLNRATLKFQYHQCDHLFVHTERMKQELMTDFAVLANRISVIPFGINNTVPNTCLSRDEARQRLDLPSDAKILLFFGNIAPYKGLEHLLSAFLELQEEHPVQFHSEFRLLIAGRPKGSEQYWEGLAKRIEQSPWRERFLLRIEFVPDEETETYFKAADVLVLPYTRIFQSGVLFLGYSFGLPVIAADIGALKEEVVSGETGFTFQRENSHDLAETLRKYFGSDLYQNLETRRPLIRDYANQRYSWTRVGEITRQVYSDLAAK